eukprot:313247-Pelagomonas_calceolata.AAC.3
MPRAMQLDSITHNELGDPDALVSLPGYPGVSPLAGWQDIPRLGLLNLKYDAMPAEYVTMIVTEYGMIPPTSVPVILREQQQDASAGGGGGGILLRHFLSLWGMEHTCAFGERQYNGLLHKTLFLGALGLA